MPFRFPLAAVLLVREEAEKREERALKKIQLEMARISRQLEDLNAEIVLAQEAREQALQQPIPAMELHAHLQRAQNAVEKKKILVHQVQTLRQELARQMMAYRAAHRDREALTEMLQKQRDDYEQEQARTLQKNLDDMFMARRHRE
jgi:flagellar export protein FliJ